MFVLCYPTMSLVKRTATKKVDHGYLFLTWAVERLYLNSTSPVFYNISWCPEQDNRKPFACKNSTTLCSAMYNGSSSQGYVQLHQQNLLKYSNYLNIHNTTSPNGSSYLSSSWENGTKRFTCVMFLNTCTDLYFHEMMKYEVIFNGINHEEYDRIDLTKGE